MRPLLVTLALVLCAAMGCDKGSAEEPPIPRQPGSRRAATASGSAELPQHVAGAPSDAEAAGETAGATASAVAALRERSLEIPPRDAPAQRIAFGRQRVAQLSENELVVRNLTDWQVVMRLPITDPRAVTSLADGSFIAAGGGGLYHLEPGSTSARRYARVPLLPGSLLLADRRRNTHFWVLHPLSSALSRYELAEMDAMLLAMIDFFELEGLGRGAFTGLKDGSFLYGAGNRLKRVFPRGKKRELDLPAQGGEVWRLLTTRRIDQVWIARSNQRLELAQITPRVSIVRTLLMPLVPYDVASSDSYVASLYSERSDAGPRRFSLIVWGPTGEEVLKVILSSDPIPAVGENWVSAVTRDKTLALSATQPFVAVGGPNRLSVWNLESGKQVL